MLPIIIVNFNSTEDTIKCISSIFNSSNKDFHVLVIDNCSEESQYQGLRNRVSEFENRYSGMITLLKSDFNGGFAYANNIGIKYAESTLKDWNYVWLLNNDTVIENDTIDKILSTMSVVPSNIGMMGHTLLYMDNPNLIQASGGHYNKILGRGENINAHCEDNTINRYPNNIDYIVGASMVIKKDFIKDVGLMTEDYFLFFEELDWIERGKKKGWDFFYTPDIAILHKHGGSTSKSNKETSFFSDKCSLRSRIMFCKRFYKAYLPSVIVASVGSALKRIFSGQFNNGIIMLKLIGKTILE